MIVLVADFSPVGIVPVASVGIASALRHERGIGQEAVYRSCHKKSL